MYMLEPFLGWLEAEHPDRTGFEGLDVNLVRTYRECVQGSLDWLPSLGGAQGFRSGPRCAPRRAPKR